MSNLTGICQLQGKEIPIQKSILKIGHVGNHSKAVWLLAWHPIKPIAETEHPIAPNLWLRSWLLLSLMTWINTCVLAVITLNSNLQNNKKMKVSLCPLCQMAVCCVYAFTAISSDWDTLTSSLFSTSNQREMPGRLWIRVRVVLSTHRLCIHTIHPWALADC